MTCRCFSKAVASHVIACRLTFFMLRIEESFNRRSSEIQGTALGKSLQAWTCIYRSMPAGVAQSRHAFVGGYSEHVGKVTDTRKQRQKRHQKCRSNTHCSLGTCRSDSRFPQLVV